MIIIVIHFMYLFKVYLILIVNQQNLRQITLIVHEKIKKKLRKSSGSFFSASKLSAIYIIYRVVNKKVNNWHFQHHRVYLE